MGAYCRIREGDVYRKWPQRAQKHNLCLLCRLWLDSIFHRFALNIEKAEPQVCRQDELPRCEFCKKLIDAPDIQDSVLEVRSLVVVGTSVSTTDHRPARLVLQQLPVLLILCNLCIDVFSFLLINQFIGVHSCPFVVRRFPLWITPTMRFSFGCGSLSSCLSC